MRRKMAIGFSVVCLAALIAFGMFVRRDGGSFGFTRSLDEIAYVTTSNSRQRTYTALADYAIVSKTAERELVAAGFTKVDQRGRGNLFFRRGPTSVFVLPGQPASLDVRYDALPGGYRPDKQHVTVMISDVGSDPVGAWLFATRRRLGL
jgi:hypothetical protein